MQIDTIVSVDSPIAIGLEALLGQPLLGDQLPSRQSQMPSSKKLRYVMAKHTEIKAEIVLAATALLFNASTNFKELQTGLARLEKAVQKSAAC